MGIEMKKMRKGANMKESPPPKKKTKKKKESPMAKAGMTWATK